MSSADSLIIFIELWRDDFVYRRGEVPRRRLIIILGPPAAPNRLAPAVEWGKARLWQIASACVNKGVA